MKILIAIGSGSFIGGVLRYLVTHFVQGRFISAFPFGTLTVNIVGCLLIGLVAGAADKSILSPEWRLFLATGVLGGFTTFSAFSVETAGLLRDGHLWQASGYVLVSVCAGLLATFVGIGITKLL
jgi:CrcB protein